MTQPHPLADPREPRPGGGPVLLTPFCQCGMWTLDEVRWRSRTKVKRVCVWCASRRPALAVGKLERGAAKR